MSADGETQNDPAARDFRLGLVIPCFRELETIPRLLDDIAAEPGLDPAFSRILVAEDGSPPEFVAAAREAVRSRVTTMPGLELLELPQNVGKGGTVRAGWNHLVSTITHLAFMDADGAVSAGEMARLVAVARQEPGKAVFASRIRMKGRRVDRHASRHYMGRVFATMVGLLIDPDVYDSQCGGKVLPAAAHLAIEPLLRETGFAFDVEILAALNHTGVKVLEIPVDWADQPDSKVRMLRDPLRMFAALWRIRARARQWPPHPTANEPE